MALPASDADRMPPPEKPPVDAWETAAVAAWVTSGGSADAVVVASTLPPSVARALNLPASPAAATTTSASGTTSEVASAPPGTVVPLRASGCGSCAVGSTPEGPTFALGLATALGLVLATRRRRARTAVSS
jgi:MYXO-CTERM domain-containing protein